MTLGISAVVSSGIVLTADSRQTYKNQVGAVRIGSDSAMKVFKLTDFSGVAISGRAFLSENNQPEKDAGFFINQFVNEEKLKGLKIKEIAEKLNKYLGDIFVERELDSLKKQIESKIKKIDGADLNFSVADGNLLPYSYKDKAGKAISESDWIETIYMIVAGIDDNKIGRAYSISIPKGITNELGGCGATSTGQTDVFTRILRGYDSEIINLDFVKEASTKDKTKISNQLDGMEYSINWSAMTIQDAIDFCVLMIRTTENIQRFSDGTLLKRGGRTGVGGEIDIAVITPQNGFKWLKKKVLKSEGAELSLDSE